MVCDFGLQAQVVGVTKFCVAPAHLAREATLVGGTKDPDLDAIAALKPTHILVNEEENKPEHIEACQRLAKTFVTFPKSPGEVPTLLRNAGAWLGVEDLATKLALETEEALSALDCAVDVERRKGAWSPQRALYLIWREPYMVVASDTYISAMMQRMGIVNVAPLEPRYPTVSVDDMKTLKPDLLLLSTEPYPFRRRDADRLRQEWDGAPPMLRIDGQLMSWYGTMLTKAAKEMARFVAGQEQDLMKTL